MKKLTKKQKAKNRANYNRIRREYEKTDKSVTYKQFKKIVMGRSKGTGETIGEAAKKTAHSYAFTTPEQIGKENLIAGLKSEFPDAYKELKSKMGKFNKGETISNRISWNKEKQMYSFKSSSGQTHYIDISNSPKEAYII